MTSSCSGSCIAFGLSFPDSGFSCFLIKNPDQDTWLTLAPPWASVSPFVKGGEMTRSSPFRHNTLDTVVFIPHQTDVSTLGANSAWRHSFRRRPHLPQVTWKLHQTLSSLNGSLCSNTKAVWLERQADAMNVCPPGEPSPDTARESDIRKKCRGWKSQRRIKTIFPHPVLRGAVFFLQLH